MTCVRVFHILLASLQVLCASELYCEAQCVSTPSTPQGTINIYYNAMIMNDFEMQKATLHESIHEVGKKRFEMVSSILGKYEIVCNRTVDKSEYSLEGEEDSDILVKEFYNNGKDSTNSFLLRKYGQKWLIIGFVTEKESEVPPPIEELEKKAEEMTGEAKGSE